MANPIKIGVGGPVGAGKTQLIEKLDYKRYLHKRRPKNLSEYWCFTRR